MDRDSLLDRGVAEYHGGALAAAASTFSQILRAAPKDAEALSNLAGVLNASQDAVGAEAACRAALEAQPGYWAALANLGNALLRQHRFDAAVQAYIAAVNANSANSAAWTSLGVAMAGQWRMQGALTAHNAALKLAPEDPDVRANRAMALLAAGFYEEGFAEYEWRWRCPTTPQHGMQAPLWLGQAEAGKTILLHEEGGFGDTMQFVRYAGLLAGREANFVLRVQDQLLRLMRRSFPSLKIVSPGCGRLPPHDLQCPVMSLPHVFGTRLETVPNQVPYLAACPDGVAAWRRRLDEVAPGVRRVGLVWAGAPRLGMAQARAMNLRRSVDPARLAPLAAVPGLRFVSLQYGSFSPAAPACLNLFDPMAEMVDFDDTASLVAALDLVITVDTAVAHLAGALGTPVWMMSRYDACWRWLAGREDCPWYPTLRVFRQPSPGDWDPVVGRIRQELEKSVLF